MKELTMIWQDVINHNLLLMGFSHAACKFIDFVIAILHATTSLLFPQKLRLELESFCLIMKRSLHSVTPHLAPSTPGLSGSFRGHANCLRTLIPRTSSSSSFSSSFRSAVSAVTFRRAEGRGWLRASQGCPTAAMCLRSPRRPCSCSNT